MKIRKTVRAIILDLTARILLIQHKELRENGTEHIFWAVPGGGVENGENDEQALKRELYEELGLSEPMEPRAVWRRQVSLPLHGTIALFDETYYLIKTSGIINFKNACTQDELDALKEARWFTEADLQACVEPILPEGFATLVSPLLRNEFPKNLVLLGDLHGRDI